MMQVVKIASGEKELSSVKKAALDALKERMWQEVWKDEIDLPGVKVSVRSLGDGLYEVTAKI